MMALEQAVYVALRETISVAAPGHAAKTFAMVVAARAGVQAPKLPQQGMYNSANNDPNAIFLELKPILERCMNDIITRVSETSEEVILKEFAMRLLAAAGVQVSHGWEQLLANRIVPNVAKHAGCTGLLIWMSASLGHEQVVRVLLSHPALDVNRVQTRSSMSALFMASQNGHPACVKLLLAHPAIDVNRAKQTGATPLYIAAAAGHRACVELLIAHPTIDVNKAERQLGAAPLLIAATLGKAACVELLLAHPAINVNQVDQTGATALIAAASSRTLNEAAVILAASGRANLDAQNNKGDSALVLAYRADDVELVAALIAHGADARPIFEHSAIADAARGLPLKVVDALRRRRSLQDVAAAKLPPLVHDCCVASWSGDDKGAAQRMASKSELAATVFEPDHKCFNGLLPPALFFAVEACGGGVAAALLGLVPGLVDGVAEEIATEMAVAAAAHDPGADGYVPGARFHAFIIALGTRGLFDVRQCKPAKRLAAWYYGSIAGVRFMTDSPHGFQELKTMAKQRLDQIAAPLDARCAREELLKHLGGIGYPHADMEVALDDRGLLPMPPCVWGAQPSKSYYEPYLIRLIRMVSLAMDEEFVRRLVAALSPLGDSVETEVVDGKPVVHVLRAGSPLVDIRAPAGLDPYK